MGGGGVNGEGGLITKSDRQLGGLIREGGLIVRGGGLNRAFTVRFDAIRLLMTLTCTIPSRSCFPKIVRIHDNFRMIYILRAFEKVL